MTCRVAIHSVLQTLKDAADHNKYVVLTKWASHEEYQTWLKDPTYRLTCIFALT